MASKQIKDFYNIDELSATALFPLQLPTGEGYNASAGQLADFTGARFASKQVNGTCSTAAAQADKRFDLANYKSADGTLPAVMSIKWVNGNTFGDTTKSTPDYINAAVYGSDGVFIGTVRLSDALGHNSGKHEAAGDIVDYRLSDDGSIKRARAINTDIRQKDTNYAIKADGSFVQDGNYVFSSAGQTEPIVYKTVTLQAIGPLTFVSAENSYNKGIENGYKVGATISSTDNTKFEIGTAVVNGYNVGVKWRAAGNIV